MPLPFGALWYTKPDGAVGYAQFYSRSHHVVIRVYDEAGNVIETQEHKRDFKECSSPLSNERGRIRTSDARAAQHHRYDRE